MKLRKRLNRNQVFYVDHKWGAGDGRDICASAFGTISEAVEHIYNDLDPAGHRCLIQVNSTSFNENVIVRGRLAGTSATDDSQDIIIRGNPDSPAACVWETAGSPCLLSNSASVAISGFRVQAVSGHNGCTGLQSQKHGLLHYFNMDFGNFPAGNQIAMAEGGHAYFDGGTYEISGTSFSAHVYMAGVSKWLVVTNPFVDCAAPMTFDDFLIMLGPNYASWAGAQWTGAGGGANSSGRQFLIQGTGVITQGGHVLPGNVAGFVDNGQVR